MALSEIFPSIKKYKKNYNNSSLLSQTKSNVYIKKGTLKENQMNLLYNLTQNKLSRDYINKLTQLLYNCKSIKNYSLKRINLDKAVYKYNNNNELYITLQNFNYRNKSFNYEHNNNNNKNSSLHNFTENGSNYLTNDTNYNVSYKNSNLEKKENKTKFDINDLYEQLEEEKLNRTIKKLLLNEDLALPKKTENQIFNRLKMKYKFEGSQNENRFLSQPKVEKRYDTMSIKANKNAKLIFPQINDRFIDYLNILKTKTNELNSIKHNKHTSHLSPLFFLGKNNLNYLNNIKYISYRKLNSDKKLKDAININEENKKYLQTMARNINTLNEINNENKEILESKNLNNNNFL